MEQTSRLSIVIDTANAQSNIERLRTSLHRLGTDGTTASNILSRMGATGGLSGVINRVGQTNNAFNRFNQTINRTHNTFNTFNRTVNNASTNITRMGDTINRNITVINNYNRSVARTHDALSRLQGLLAGGMFGVFALSVAKTADSMQETHSQIKLVTKSHEEYLVVADRLHEMAGKNLKDFQATTGLYTNSARALGQLGKSQEEVLKFTNAVSLAMGVGGKSAQEQASAILQLGQAMQSGVVQGDEFRSLAENAPIMLDLVAEKLGKTRGEVRELSKEGKITAEVMYNALADATPKLQEMFDKMPITMSQGFSVLKNEYKKFAHEFMNGEGGISSVIAKGLIWLSKNFDTLGKVAIAGAGVAMLGFASKVKITTTAFTVLGNVIKAHPVLAIATAVLGVASAFYGLDDVLNTTGIIFGDFFDLVTTGWKSLSDLAEAVAFNIRDDFAKSNQETATGFGVFFADTEKGFTGLLRGISRIVASATGVLGGFFAWINTKTTNALLRVDNAFIGLGNSIGSVFANIANSIMDFLTSAVKKTNEMIGGLNQMLAKLPFGSFEIAPIDFDFGGRFQFKPMPYKSLHTATLSQHISDYVGMAADIENSTIGSYLQNVGKRAGTKNNPPVDLNIPGQPPKPSSSDDKDKKGRQGKTNENLNTKEGRMMMVFRAFKNAGFSDEQARQLTAQVGRENEYQIKYLFGTHSDNNNNKTNIGMISWQGTRGNNITREMKQAGLIKNGKMVQSQEALDFQARYLAREMMEDPSYARTRRDFLGTDNPSYEKGMAALDQNFIKWDWRGKKIDAPSHYKRQRGHYVNITNQTKDLRDYQQEAKEQQKIQEQQQEIHSWFATERQKRDAEFIRKQNEIINNFSGNPEMGKLLDQLTNNYIKSDKYLELKFELETKGDMMNIWERADKELALKLSEIDLSDLSDEQKKLRRDMAHEAHARHTLAMAIEEQEKDLRLNGWRRSPLEVLKAERDIAINKINTTRTAEEMTQGYTPEQQAIDDFYSMKIAKYHEGQAKKVAEFERTIADTAKNGYRASLLNMMGEKYLPKQIFAKMQLQNTHKQRLAEEYQRFDDLVNYINAQNEDGQFEIEDIKERQRLIQEAEIVHQTELQAIKERFAEENKQLEVDTLSQSMQTYSSAFGEISGIIKAFGGEQSKAYRTMFAISKSFALADIGIKMGQAIAQTWSDPTATTIWQKLANVAKVTLAQGHLMKMVGAVKGFATGGYTGNLGTSQIAGVVHGQEYVLNAKATKRIGVDNLNKLNSGSGLGGNVNNISVHVTVNTDGSSDVQANHQMGKQMGEAMVMAARQVLYQETRQNGYLDKLYRR